MSRMKGKLCMVCDTQATRFLEGYAYCDFHDRSKKPRLPSMGQNSRVYRTAPAVADTGREAEEATEARWQKAIYDLCKKSVGPTEDYRIDGGGCDSGDALDFTLTELGQTIEIIRQAATAVERASNAELAELIGVAAEDVYETETEASELEAARTTAREIAAAIRGKAGQ